MRKPPALAGGFPRLWRIPAMSETPKRPGEELVKGLFGGLQTVIDTVQHLAVSGAESLRKGVFPEGTGLHGVYGFTIRADVGKPTISVTPFGNVHPGAGGEATLSEYAEPRVEVGDEAGCFVVSAEVPGVGAEDVHLSVVGNTLMITAEKARRKYRKEVPLPPAASAESMLHAVRDGVLEVRFRMVPPQDTPLASGGPTA
jgi:HSP20 family molecular chaperone IbpA